MGTSVAVLQATAIFEIRLLELANSLDSVAGEAPGSVHLFLPSPVYKCLHSVLFAWVLGTALRQ